MIEGERIVDCKVKEPSCRMVMEWLVDVYNNIPEQIEKMHNRKWVLSSFNYSLY